LAENLGYFSLIYNNQAMLCAMLSNTVVHNPLLMRGVITTLVDFSDDGFYITNDEMGVASDRISQVWHIPSFAEVGKGTITKPYHNNETDIMVVSLLTPILNQERQVEGVLLLDMDFSIMLGMLVMMLKT
jgi:hypothetical protein